MINLKLIKNFLSIIFPFFLFSQVSQGEIHYNVNVDKFLSRSTKKNYKESTKKIFFDASKEMIHVNVVLKFNKEKAFFSKEKSMEIDDNLLAGKIANLWTNKGNFYSDLSEKKQILIRNFQGEKYKVSLDFEKRKWILSQEKKQIGDFICYKATMTKKTVGGEFPVEAWYTPEIPYSYGPLNYVGNLPGLILELHDTEMSYIAKFIKINSKKEIKINWPQSGDFISKEDYNKKNDRIKKIFAN